MILYKKQVLSILVASTFTSFVFAQGLPAVKTAPTANAVTLASPSKPAAIAPVAAPAKLPLPEKVSYGPDYKGETFDKIKSSGKISIGVRSSSIPISYYDANKKPMGYGVDICLNIVDKIKEKLAMPNLAVEYFEVNTENLEATVKAGKVDMECGSTSNFAKRRLNVDFTIPYYISSIRILTKNNSGIQSLSDLKNRKVSVAAGTTSIPLLQKFNKERNLNITIVEEKGFPAAFQALESGKADAFVLLDLVLLSESTKSLNSKNYSLVGEPLTIFPLSIMIRKDDPKFKSFLDKEMMSLISSGKISNYYTKWFESPIPPNNKNLNVPKSSLFKDLLRMPTSITGS